jgi:hemolysin activation/secretion protein
MKFFQMAGVVTLSVALCGLGFAQTNVQTNQQTQRQLKQEQKADKAQAKADKEQRKALKTKQAKKAAKAQDKAGRSTAVGPWGCLGRGRWGGVGVRSSCGRCPHLRIEIWGTRLSSFSIPKTFEHHDSEGCSLYKKYRKNDQYRSEGEV